MYFSRTNPACLPQQEKKSVQKKSWVSRKCIQHNIYYWRKILNHNYIDEVSIDGSLAGDIITMK